MAEQDDALDRLEAALDRIEAAPPAVANPIAPRLDALITQLRDALQSA